MSATWRSRPRLAWAVRCCLVAVPVLLAVAMAAAVSRLVDGPYLVRLLAVLTAAAVTLLALERVGRRFLPLVTLLRLALIQGAVLLSANAGHTHWLAVMEPTLLRLLRSTGIHFEPLGPKIDYHGLRQPAVAELVPMLTQLAHEQPVVWDFLTQRGTFYPKSRSILSMVDRVAVSRPLEFAGSHATQGVMAEAAAG